MTIFIPNPTQYLNLTTTFLNKQQFFLLRHIEVIYGLLIVRIGLQDIFFIILMKDYEEKHCISCDWSFDFTYFLY